MYKIIYVCTGNTCRSPMAEGILRKLLDDAGINDVEVMSAGIGTLDGYPATLNSVEAASRHGVDISHHHSSRMTEKLFSQSDLVFALAGEHYEFLSENLDIDDKLFMVKAFPEQGLADEEHSVLDPIGGSLEEYNQTFQEIDREIKRAFPEIVRRINHK